MPVDERTRRVMTEGLVAVLGEEVTDALLTHLPPVGWADVATKQDLGAAEARLGAKVDRLEARFHREISRLSRLYVFSMIVVVAAVASLS